MIYINEYTGQEFKSAEECEKSEQKWRKKREEELKAKREAEAEEQKKKDQIKEAYKKAIQAVDEATKATEDYLDLCKKLGYHVSGSFDFSPLMKLIFEL